MVSAQCRLANGATAATVFIISYGYSRIIEQFPGGGGGYLVASKVLGGPAGVTAGAALAAGVVNGLGSIGGVMQELVTTVVSERWGWTTLFYVFLVLSLLAAVSLVPTFSGKGARAEDA